MDSKEEATATSGNMTLEIPASVPSYVIISEQIPKTNGEGTGQHGGRREYLWSDEATEKLVLMVKENYSKVTGGRDGREEVFREITKKLVEYIPGITVRQVHMKWKNLKQRFKKYELKKSKDRYRVKEPLCYNLLCSFLERPSVPTYDVICCDFDEEEEELLQQHQRHPLQLQPQKQRMQQQQVSIIPTIEMIEEISPTDSCTRISEKTTDTNKRRKLDKLTASQRRMESLFSEVLSEMKKNNSVMESFFTDFRNIMKRNEEHQLELIRTLKERNQILKQAVQK
ncbi:uncharacterized protein LOC125032481 [Penaeus chinensis]|uniref:uncharacterized protein LOC125032481 n=1 Tax=Penaeus chinensis TaxID=139456 RepID=UPI001FB61F12|nr:uncharacterized protein LOC125032481 [Penaeus chinensis]